MARAMLRLLLFAALGIVIAHVILLILSLRESWVERTFIFFPDKKLEATPRQAGLDFQEVYFDGGGLRLHGWYVPARDKATVLLWLHGNGGNISYEMDGIALLNQSGLGIFIFDYQGYGKSEGQPSEAGVYRDARAAYEYLKNGLSVTPDRIVLFGRSLGGAVAADLALQAPARALILDGAFTSLGDMANHHYRWLPGKGRYAHKFDTAGKLARISIPKLIIHGDRDRVVPFWMGRRLYEVASPPKEFYPIAGAGHEDTMEVGGREYLLRVAELIRAAQP
ncbi:MAG: alpha/beta hydrolase [Deltaproteobacteria bacterium]|nr:alpha/beta hydrolase [Deltaproteobacteria bacterium]